MAVGDDAASAGFPLVPNTGEEGKVRYGAREINRTRDFLAQDKATVRAVSKGGTGADNAAQARTNLGAMGADHVWGGASLVIHSNYFWNLMGSDYAVPAPGFPNDANGYYSYIQDVVHAADVRANDLEDQTSDLQQNKAGLPPSGGRTVGDCNGGNTIGIFWNGSAPVVRVDGSVDVTVARADTVNSLAGSKANAFEQLDGVRYSRGPDGTAYNRQATTNRVPTYMDDSLQFGRATSARKYKEDIEPVDLDPQDVLALVPVTYHRKIDPEGTREFGLIADDVQETLPEIVTWFPDEDGVKQIDGINYELLSVALLSVVKDQQKRIEALERIVLKGDS